MVRILLFILLTLPVLAQKPVEETLDKALVNAKKGMYWALGNIPNKKSSASNDLIEQDKLISSVRLSKEINGIRIESTGYYEGTQVKLTIFKSSDMLLKEGWIKPDSVIAKETAIADSLKKAAKKKSSRVKSTSKD